ncbi:MAG: hypothetical protein GX572_04655 [Clostridia bacterium]|nr:hypothetical protein [Clostridia bacterium]
MVWGLFLPAVFLLILLFLSIVPYGLIDGFGLDALGKNTFSALCVVGSLTSVLILAFTRVGKQKRQKRREKERQERIEAKQQRLAAENACLEEGMSVSRSAELAGLEKMAQARRQALAESEQKLLALAQKRQAATAAADAAQPDGGISGAAADAAQPDVGISGATANAAQPDGDISGAAQDSPTAADTAHINRLFSPENGGRTLPLQIVAAASRFGGKTRQYGRAAGQAVVAVSRRAGLSMARAAGDFWSAARPQLAAAQQKTAAVLAAGKKQLIAWAARVKDKESGVQADPDAALAGQPAAGEEITAAGAQTAAAGAAMQAENAKEEPDPDIDAGTDTGTGTDTDANTDADTNTDANTDIDASTDTETTSA